MAGCTGTGSCYWIGGTGNTNDVDNWATTSGGGTTGGLPSAVDDAIFDSASHNDDYTVTVNATMVCKDFIMDKPDGVGKKVTWAGSSILYISGSLTLTGGTAGITMTYSGQIIMNATSGTVTIDSNGISISAPLRFDGDGGTFQLASNYISKFTSGSYVLARYNGTFDANAKLVTLTTAYKALLGFYDTNSFYDLTITNDANKHRTTTLNTDLGVTNTLTITGNSAINRLLVRSSTVGTTRTITAATTSLTNVDFRDITGAGEADWTGTSLGDCGGNTGITFTATVERFSVAAGNWSSTDVWSATTGGAAGASVPLPQDTATLETANNVTIDMPRFCKDLVATDYTGTLASGTLVIENYGDITLGSGMTLTGTGIWTLAGRGTQTITSAGIEFARGVTINAPGGTYILADAFVQKTSSGFLLTLGTFDAATNNVDVGLRYFNSKATSITNMGSGTWDLSITVAANVWTALGTINAGTSTIKVTGTENVNLIFIGGSKTYNNIWFSRGTSTGNISIKNSNTFAELKDTGTEAHSLIFNAGTTQTIGAFDVSGSAGKLITLTSSSTATYNLIYSSSGNVSVDYLDVAHSVATPGYTWYAGDNSTDSQADATAGSGWVFEVAPVGVDSLRTRQGYLNILLGTSKISVQDSLNTLAGTTKHTSQEAANIWAGTTKLTTQEAVNIKCGTTKLSVQNALRYYVE